MIGTAEVISSLGRRAITSYHRTMYFPGNVVVAAAEGVKAAVAINKALQSEELIR